MSTNNNPTRRKRNIYDRIVDSLESQEKTFIQNLKVASTDSSVSLSGLGGGSGSGGGNPGGGAFLPLAGGSMNGPIAYQPKPASTSIDNLLKGHLNISKDKGIFTSDILINGSPSSWGLSYIDGDYWDGQILKIHVPVTQTLVLKSDGNIQFETGLVSLLIIGPSYVELTFNSTISPNGNQGGWEITGPILQINGCDIATKCYVDSRFAIAGFTQSGVIEYILEFANVLKSSTPNANMYQNEALSEIPDERVIPKSLNLVPGSGPVGTVVTVKAFSFVEGQTLRCNFDGVLQTTTPANPVVPTKPSNVPVTYEIETDFTFTVPAHATGPVTVHVFDAIGGDVADATFTIT